MRDIKTENAELLVHVSEMRGAIALLVEAARGVDAYVAPDSGRASGFGARAVAARRLRDAVAVAELAATLSASHVRDEHSAREWRNARTA